ncbi:MAG: glycosyltransferase family 9 protein [Candidatus Omnitrophica bacterium]|nr:glycosyltransferase family 9 protein [Candidatus Omnitrophota bacterium]
MPKIEKSKIKRILVITLSNIGDIVLTTPVVEALLREYPEAMLDIIAGPGGYEVFKKHGKISEVIIYDKKSSFLGKLRFFLGLWKKRYDFVVDLRNTVLPFLLGARYNTNPFRRDSKRNIHKKDVHLSRLKDMGIDTSGASFYLSIDESDRKYIEDTLAPLGGKPFVVVSPGAKSHVKRWPLKNFAKLSDMIKQNLGYETVLVGDEYDKVVTQRILHLMKAKPLNLAEKTNIRQLAYLIKKSSLVITNDSAPLHVASAMDARVLAFFGPTDEKKYGPATKAPSKVLRKKMGCAPCEVAQCVNVGNKYECLKAITVEEAFEAVKELLL